MTESAMIFWTKLSQYLYNIDDDGRMYLKAQSDSTAIFLFEMRVILEALGCTDICTKGYPAPTEKIPKDKPWCNWIDEVNGVLPLELRSCFKRKDVENEEGN